MKKQIIYCLYFALALQINGQSSYPGLTAWYHSRAVGLAGSGSVSPQPESDRLNPAAMRTDGREFALGLMAYPAGIRAGQLVFRFPWREGIAAFSFRTMNYGTFDGYDSEGSATGAYTAGDTWLGMSYAHSILKENIRAGLTTGVFFSRLADFSSHALVFTPGVVIALPELELKTGLSLQNLGVVLDSYAGVKEPLPTSLVAGLSKKLLHLPVTVCADLGYSIPDQIGWLSLGGVVHLSRYVEFQLGTSSRKFDQTTEVILTRDLLGSSGLGISLNYEDIQLDFGSYFFGTGGWTHGFGCEVQF